IFVTPAGATERTVGTNFAFRTEQNTVTSLDFWGAFVSASPAGSVTVCNFTVTPQQGGGRTFTVSTIAELQSRINNAIPGDEIILRNGAYTSGSAINIDRQGTAAQPILIRAETTGGAEIRGTASFSVNSPAAFIVIRGFRLTHAIGTVQVRPGTSHIRLT